MDARGNVLVRLAALTALLAASSCIFDADPAAPGFPIEPMTAIPMDTLGAAPERCSAVSGGALLVSGGSRTAVVDLEDGILLGVLDVGASVSDLGDTDVSGYAWILTEDRLIPLGLDTWETGQPIQVAPGSEHLALCAETGTAWVTDASDGLGEVDLASGTVQACPGGLVRDCRGLACSRDGSALFAADGADSVIIMLSTESWTPTARLDLPGEPVDLFVGPEGYVCCIVEGSNEVWFVDEETGALTLMTTVPESPVAAAVMPDMSYCYASCPGIGLVVVAASGQLEYKGSDLGFPSSIAIGGDGERTALCCPEEGVVRILR